MFLRSLLCPITFYHSILCGTEALLHQEMSRKKDKLFQILKKPFLAILKEINKPNKVIIYLKKQKQKTLFLADIEPVGWGWMPKHALVEKRPF